MLGKLITLLFFLSLLFFSFSFFHLPSIFSCPFKEISLGDCFLLAKTFGRNLSLRMKMKKMRFLFYLLPTSIPDFYDVDT